MLSTDLLPMPVTTDSMFVFVFVHAVKCSGLSHGSDIVIAGLQHALSLTSEGHGLWLGIAMLCDMTAHFCSC